MEIAMKKDWSGDYRGGGTVICAGSLRRKVGLPKDTSKIYAVFTKKKTSNSFLINPPYDGWIGQMSRVDGFSGALLTTTKLILGRAYNKGFRYVRIDCAAQRYRYGPPFDNKGHTES